MYRYIGVVLAAGLLFNGCGNSDNPLTATEGGPRIVAHTPSANQSFVASNQRFAVEFSESMDRQSVESNFQVTIAQKPVAGTNTWNTDGTAVAFQPAVAFSPGSQVQVNFQSGMRSRRGQALVGQDGQPAGSFGFGCIAYGYPTTFSSNGQRIYYTATSASGQPITFVMGNNSSNDPAPGSFFDPVYGPMMGGMMGMGMMGGNRMGTGVSGHTGMACVNCHGPDGSGGRYLAMGTVRTPDIRYMTLTGQQETEEDGHAHEAYTDDLIQRAITQGLEADGDPLNFFMPRWSMSEQDMEELIAFLKTL